MLSQISSKLPWINARLSNSTFFVRIRNLIGCSYFRHFIIMEIELQFVTHYHAWLASKSMISFIILSNYIQSIHQTCTETWAVCDSSPRSLHLCRVGVWRLTQVGNIYQSLKTLSNLLGYHVFHSPYDIFQGI